MTDASVESLVFSAIQKANETISLQNKSSSGNVSTFSQSVTEQQAQILSILRNQPHHKGYSFDQIEQISGINLHSNNSLLASLKDNPKVEFNAQSGFLKYRTLYQANDRYELLRLLRTRGRIVSAPSSSGGDESASPSAASSYELPGFPIPDLLDTYPNAARDILDLTRMGGEVALQSDFASGGSSKQGADLRVVPKGGILRVRSIDTTKPDMVWHRDSPSDWVSSVPLSSFTCLSGTVSVEHGSAVVTTTSDLTLEIFRNDVIIIDGKVYRVDSKSYGASGLGDFSGVGSRAAATLNLQPMSGTEIDAGALDDVKDEGEDDEHQDDEGEEVPEDASELPQVVSASPGGAQAAPSSRRSARPSSVYAEIGVGTVSVGNGVMNTGGHYSVADTAPHTLKSSSMGYLHCFTASSLPIDQPWPGPSKSGLKAFKVGTTGDLRLLWREIVTHGTLKAVAATSAYAASGSSAHGAGITGLAAAEALVTALGGTSAFKGSKPFPSTHRELRAEMAKFGLDLACPMEPGTLNPLIQVPAPGQGKATNKRVVKQRRPDKRSFSSLLSNSHLQGTQIEHALKVARLEILKEQYGNPAKQGN
jgi:hypothetical protein